MAESLDDHYEKLSDLNAKIRKRLDGFLESKDQGKDLETLDYDLRLFENRVDYYKTNMSDVSAAERKKHRPLHKTQKKNFEDLKVRISVCKEQQNRNALYGEAKIEVLDPNDTSQLLDSAVDTSKDSSASTIRTLAMVTEMNQLGRDTNQKLEKQTEQMIGTMEGAMEIESELKRGRAVAMRILRRTAMDPVMWVLILLVLCAIVALIVMSVVNGDSAAADAVDLNQL